MNIKDLVKDGKKVKFSFYRDNEFWYETDGGFKFPIHLDEVLASKVTLPAEDKAILYMRWIRKYMDLMKDES